MRGPGFTVLLTLACACGFGGSGQGGQNVTIHSPPAGPSASSGSTFPMAPTRTSGGSASVLIGRLDSSPECDGLVPQRVPAPVDVKFTPPSGATCAGGTTDGTGHVAVSTRTVDGTTWQIFRPDGTLASAVPAWTLVPEPSGWHGLTVNRVVPGTPVAQAHYSPDGVLLDSAPADSDPGHLQSDVWSLGQDPNGGSFTLVGETDLFHNHFTVLEAQRFDVAGAARWPRNLRLAGNGDHSIEFLAAGVSSRGEALTLVQHSASLDVSWLDGGGATVAAQVRAEPYGEVLGSRDFRRFELQLFPLLDGGLALRVDGTFRRAYARLATLSTPLPGWLAERATSTLRFTRGDLGYAAFPPAGQALPTCEQVVELLAPSGRLCGRVTLLGDGRACTSGAVDQGWDGTVVQQRAQGGCAYRFWPRLLAR